MIHLANISVEILYGKFPKTINFSLYNFFSLILRISSFIIIILFSNFFFKSFTKNLSFSTTISFFGLFFKI